MKKLKLKNKELKKKAFNHAKSVVEISGKRPNKTESIAIMSVASDYTSGYIQAMKDAQLQINSW